VYMPGVVMEMSLMPACAVCFGNPDDPMTTGAMAGILFLVGVITGVLSTIALTAYRWSRKSKSLQRVPPSNHE
jgi:EamA domain-containing membrane protein RarD